jgi:hypothetical protein
MQLGEYTALCSASARGRKLPSCFYWYPRSLLSRILISELSIFLVRIQILRWHQTSCGLFQRSRPLSCVGGHRSIFGSVCGFAGLRRSRIVYSCPAFFVPKLGFGRKDVYVSVWRRGWHRQLQLLAYEAHHQSSLMHPRSVATAPSAIVTTHFPHAHMQNG